MWLAAIPQVKFGQALMAGTLGSELTSRANAWQQDEFDLGGVQEVWLDLC